PDRLRLGDHAHHRTGRTGAGNDARRPEHPAGDAPRPGRAGAPLCVSRLRPAGALVRRPSPHLLGRWRTDATRQPGSDLPDASPESPRGGLEIAARERRPLGGDATAPDRYGASANRLSGTQEPRPIGTRDELVTAWCTGELCARA